MAKLTKMERLRHFVNAAHNYAMCEYGCTLTILQEHKEENHVIVALYGLESNPERDDPDTMCQLAITSAEVPYNCNFVVDRDGKIALINVPADLFRLLYT